MSLHKVSLLLGLSLFLHSLLPLIAVFKMLESLSILLVLNLLSLSAQLNLPNPKKGEARSLNKAEVELH